jgi:hypothetical protein
MLLLFITGLLSGIVSGMGIGGGTVLIPALCLFFDMPQKAAQNINLIYFIPTAVVALITHIKNKRIEAKSVKHIVPFGIAGAIIGSVIALNTDNSVLRVLFGWFLLAMGVREIYMGVKKNKN